MDLPINDHGVDQPPTIVYNDILEDIEVEGTGVNFHDHGMRAGGCGAHFRPKIGGGLQAGFRSGLNRAPEGVGPHSQISQADFRLWNTPHLGKAINQLNIRFAGFKVLGCLV